jgi:hypothetical protein
MGYTLYEQVLEDPDLLVQIILPPKLGSASSRTATTRDDFVIKGYLESPFDMANSATWSDKLFGKDYANSINDILGKFGSSTIVQTILDTTQQYIVANIPQFTLSFYMLAVKDGDNPLKTVNRLYEAIYPEKTSDATVVAHWGYKPNSLGEEGGGAINLNSSPTIGTVIVKIGRWFEAINLIIKDVQLGHSEAPDPYGRPNYIKVSVTLSPRRLPYASEIKAWFKHSQPKQENT